ncbi:hypothetical protein CSPX01_17350 [Colletotrichum filicis]|nr:hypothetical protein CSPX01_17350 [Colletotrichum filicis]
MASSLRCFIDEVSEPIKLVDVVRCGVQRVNIEAADIKNLEILTSHISKKQGQDYSLRLLSICQRNSWRPLQITSPMFHYLVEAWDMHADIWDLTSCFYSKGSDVEDVFYIPFTVHRAGPVLEILYSIRYPEFKETQQEWVIRQTGVYQKVNLMTSQNLVILFNPSPNTSAQKHAESWIPTHEKDIRLHPLWIHNILLGTYLPNWRLYSAHLEKRFLPIANNAVATFVDELTGSEHRHLTELAILDHRFLQIPVILKGSQEILRGLTSISEDLNRGCPSSSKIPPQLSVSHFEKHYRRCEACFSEAQYLQQRVQGITLLLANTLSFREQLDARSQNNIMLHLNKSAMFITTLTLLYLPASFMATFFGMNFFDFDEKGRRILGTSMIWIYVLCSAALTAVTFLFYRMLVDRQTLGKIEFTKMMRLGFGSKEVRSPDVNLSCLSV